MCKVYFFKGMFFELLDMSLKSLRIFCKEKFYELFFKYFLFCIYEFFFYLCVLFGFFIIFYMLIINERCLGIVKMDKLLVCKNRSVLLFCEIILWF